MYFNSKKILNYFRLTPDHRMLFGGRHQLRPGGDLGQSARNLKSAMVDIFPQLSNAKITHSWSGTLAVTSDLMPHLQCRGPLTEAYGYCGHGVSMASYLGWEASQHILGRPISEFHHQRKPFLPIPPLCENIILPFLSQYYSMLDARKS